MFASLTIALLWWLARCHCGTSIEPVVDHHGWRPWMHFEAHQRAKSEQLNNKNKKVIGLLLLLFPYVYRTGGY